jgi:hypothetical protein
LMVWDHHHLTPTINRRGSGLKQSVPCPRSRWLTAVARNLLPKVAFDHTNNMMTKWKAR